MRVAEPKLDNNSILSNYESSFHPLLWRHLLPCPEMRLLTYGQRADAFYVWQTSSS